MNIKLKIGKSYLDGESYFRITCSMEDMQYKYIQSEGISHVLGMRANEYARILSKNGGTYCHDLRGIYFKYEEDISKTIEELESVLLVNTMAGKLK